jgi:hypothetical protein
MLIVTTTKGEPVNPTVSQAPGLPEMQRGVWHIGS